MLLYNDIIEIGTEVMIFKYVPKLGIEQDLKNYIKGIIIDRKISSDNSSLYVINYTVLGDDGKKYYGNYRRPTIGGNFFLTQEDYVYYLKNRISSNNLKISAINHNSKEMQKMIEKVQNEQRKEKILIK